LTLSNDFITQRTRRFAATIIFFFVEDPTTTKALQQTIA